MSPCPGGYQLKGGESAGYNGTLIKIRHPKKYSIPLNKLVQNQLSVQYMYMYLPTCMSDGYIMAMLLLL